MGKTTTVACLVLGAVLLVGTACRQAAAPEAAPPPLLHTATIKDIMDSMVDPSADYLFDAVSVVADEHGVTEKYPRTDEEWKEVRRRAMQLIEAPNLLLMPGRAVANPGDKAENAGIELEPAQIKALIDGDVNAFAARARVLQDAGMLALKASQDKNKEALFEAAGSIDKACENCHLHYWYPNDTRAQEAFKEAEKSR